MSTMTIGGSELDASWFLILGAILFIIGATGVLVRRNPLVILICIELMLNAVNLTLITFSRQLQNLDGQLFALMSLTVAAAEAVIGLGILVDIFRLREIVEFAFANVLLTLSTIPIALAIGSEGDGFRIVAVGR